VAARQANRYLWRANAGTKNALAGNRRLSHPTTIRRARNGRAITLPQTVIRLGVADDLPRRVNPFARVRYGEYRRLRNQSLRVLHSPLLKSRHGFYFSGLVNPSPCQSLAKSSVSASSTIGLQGLANDVFGPDPLSPFTGIVDSSSAAAWTAARDWRHSGNRSAGFKARETRGADDGQLRDRG